MDCRSCAFYNVKIVINNNEGMKFGIFGSKCFFTQGLLGKIQNFQRIPLVSRLLKVTIFNVQHLGNEGMSDSHSLVRTLCLEILKYMNLYYKKALL
jgi:hypothetical protein